MRGRSSPKKGGQAAQALGRSRGGFSTKIHVSVDGLGNPLRFILTGGQQHDSTQAEELIAGYAGEHVLADKGYDAQEFRQHILELGMIPVIPPRSNRKEPADYDRHLYRERDDAGTDSRRRLRLRPAPGDDPCLYHPHLLSSVKASSIGGRIAGGAQRSSSV